MLVLALLFLVACGSLDPRDNLATDRAFDEYVRLFEEATGEDVIDVPINFGIVQPLAAGECNTYANLFQTYPEITIDREWWRANFDPRIREILITHELGHCLFGLSHNDNWKDGQPESFMYPGIWVYDLEIFAIRREKYYNELTQAYQARLDRERNEPRPHRRDLHEVRRADR